MPSGNPNMRDYSRPSASGKAGGDAKASGGIASRADIGGRAVAAGGVGPSARDKPSSGGYLGGRQTAFDRARDTGLRGPLGPHGEARMGPSHLDSMGLRGKIFSDPRSAAVAHMIGRGWTPEQAAGIVGNLVHESAGLNPNAVGDQGTAYGYGQWRGSRLEGLRNFAGSARPSPFAQLDWVDKELRGLDGAYTTPDVGAAQTGRAFMANPEMSGSRAAAMFMNRFERPLASAGRASLGDRTAFGQLALANLQHGTPSQAMMANAGYGVGPLSGNASGNAAPVRSASAAPTYSDSPQGSWMGSIYDKIVEPGLAAAKAYADDYAGKAMAPENVGKFAGLHPLQALKLASLFQGGNGQPMAATAHEAGNQAWFNGEQDKRKAAAPARYKRRAPAPAPASVFGAWAPPDLLTTPYRTI